MRNLHVVFPGGCTNLHSRQQCTGVPMSKHLHVCLFGLMDILTNVWWYLLWFWFTFPWWLVILSIFSHTCWLFVCLLWKSAYLFFFCDWTEEIPSVFWLLTPYLVYDLQVLFPHPVGCLAFSLCWLFPLLYRSFQFGVASLPPSLLPSFSLFLSLSCFATKEQY